MSSGRVITAWFIVVIIFTAIFYDIYIGVTHGGDSTISWVTWTTAKNYPAIPFAIGFICGHLFWSQQTKERKRNAK